MRLIGLILFAIVLAMPARAESPRVVADVAPIHSLVAQVMEGVGEPELLIPAIASPHTHALKFSDAKRLSKAVIVFWVGEGLTPWLEKGLDTLATDATAVELLEVDGLTLISTDHDDHAHDDDHHGAVDPHIWLDPNNAIILVAAIADTLAEVDPANAARYSSNAEKTRRRLIKQRGVIEKLLKPIKGQRYIVQHDGYRYFEEQFNLGRAYVIADSHSVRPGAKRVSEIRRIVSETGARCIFSELQQEQRTIAAIARGTDVKTALLDPMGYELTPGPDLYGQVIKTTARTLIDCFRK